MPHPDMRTLGYHSGTILLTLSRQLFGMRFAKAHREPNPSPVLNNAWTAKVSRVILFMEQAGSDHCLFQVQISMLRC